MVGKASIFTKHVLLGSKRALVASQIAVTSPPALDLSSMSRWARSSAVARPRVQHCSCSTVDASGLDHQSSAFERRATEPCARCERRPCWPQQLCCRKMLCDCSRGDPKHDCICTKAYKPSTVSGLRGVRPYFQHTFRRRTSSEAYTAISTGFSTRCLCVNL